MHRSRVSRLLAGLLAAWLAVITVEPAALHACAMHGGASAAGVEAAATHVAHGTHAHAASADADRTAPDDGGACTCLGHCCGAAPLAFAAPRLALRAALGDPPLQPGRPAHEYVAAWVAFVLPFATAPPVAVAA